ncbi:MULTISPECIES: hypothetical protein [Halobacterium]|uniref:DUF8123 domain-containing protein n=4 Tax=Halobacterium salinarum TaxID=2242 RepID=Q9HMJ9_HALSA|nr:MULTISPECIES: hypothetical protein [Halobacterium]AAG20572.1 hypothetical protein VNG_2510H [Halobacterium salinarum NRC-1]MBB6089493.1 hypothetical protein [Halobacterium salinarum]MCF2164523.1 hypothetical protein [Halobacterium salinarum]MCF2167030.1 hypothetical protein [Halobacterium salinarum]MCF2207740.1 hypothetical protein [Halobacterium salinarum]
MNGAADTLDVLGVSVGAFVALVGAATLVGMPWQYGPGGAVTAFQISGAVAAIAVGVGVAWLTRAN